MSYTKAITKILTTMETMGFEVGCNTSISLNWIKGQAWLYLENRHNDNGFELGFFETKEDMIAYFSDGRKSSRFLKKVLMNSIIVGKVEENLSIEALPEVSPEYQADEKIQYGMFLVPCSNFFKYNATSDDTYQVIRGIEVCYSYEYGTFDFTSTATYLSNKQIDPSSESQTQ